MCLAKSGHTFRRHDKVKSSSNKCPFINKFYNFKKYNPFWTNILKNMFFNQIRNESYLSNHIQNDLIQTLHNIIQWQIPNLFQGKNISMIANKTSQFKPWWANVSSNLIFWWWKKLCSWAVCLQILIKLSAAAVFKKPNYVLVNIL